MHGKPMRTCPRPVGAIRSFHSITRFAALQECSSGGEERFFVATAEIPVSGDVEGERTECLAPGQGRSALIGFGIMLAGIVLCVVQICPDKSTIVAHPDQALSVGAWQEACWCVVMQPGPVFRAGIWTLQPAAAQHPDMGNVSLLGAEAVCVDHSDGRHNRHRHDLHAVYHGFPAQGFAPL